MALIETNTIASPSVTAIRETKSVSVKNVLFATDFSTISESALPYATAIARRFGSTLHLAHVMSDAGLLMMTGGVDYVSMGTIYEDAHTEAKERLERVALRVGSIPHRCHVRHGLAWKNLMALIEEHDIDLVVVGTHGRTGFGKIILGSVAENILRHALCPVLTIGPRISGHAKLPALQGKTRDVAPADLDIREILFATNFAPHAARAAALLAEQFRSRLTLLHVIEEYTELANRPGPIEDGLRKLQELIPSDAALQYAPERAMEFGPASECILKVAADKEADMIVLGARPPVEVATTHLPWSTAHYVLTHAHCPVLTIRD